MEMRQSDDSLCDGGIDGCSTAFVVEEMIAYPEDEMAK
jgi:hypothetical protein